VCGADPLPPLLSWNVGRQQQQRHQQEGWEVQEEQNVNGRMQLLALAQVLARGSRRALTSRAPTCTSFFCIHHFNSIADLTANHMTLTAHRGDATLQVLLANFQ
jgi:hypothetical protein